MSEFSDDVLRDFLAEGESQEATKERFEVIYMRGQLFLSERGIEFPLLASTPTEQQTEDEVIRAMMADQVRAHNAMRLVELSSAILMYTVANEIRKSDAPHETAATIKKRLQAEYVVDGLPPAWGELVDAELPGEPLGDGDGELVAEVTQQMSQGRAQGAEQVAATANTILDILSESGIDITVEDNMIATGLAALHGVLTLSGRAKKEWPESARIFFADRDISITPAWQAVIDRLAK